MQYHVTYSNLFLPRKQDDKQSKKHKYKVTKTCRQIKLKLQKKDLDPKRKF